MKRFSSDCCIAQSNNDVIGFVGDWLTNARKVLFIGTVGMDVCSLYFPTLLASTSNVDFRFIIEQRPNVSSALVALGRRHRAFLEGQLAKGRLAFSDVKIIAEDGATVAGRNAVGAAHSWLQEDYSDILIDATGMSRSTCFPIVQQALKSAAQTHTNVHVVVAATEHRAVEIRAESNDRADWVHGFQGLMGTDRMNDALKLWVPQLTEGAASQLNLMFTDLMPVAEVCPIVPFPSANPRRGDELLFEYGDSIRAQWESSSLNTIYAHESDPLDVFRSICHMNRARAKVFDGGRDRAVTILSPAGWRIGSLGMLLAAIDLELPILYVETVGYNSDSDMPQMVEVRKPDHLWHIWLAGDPYSDGTQ